MKWPWSTRRKIATQAGDLLNEFDDSLLLIVDPEQLTSNLLGKLRQLVDVEKAFVFLAGETTSPKFMTPVGMNGDAEELPQLSVKGRLVLWFRTNRRLLSFAEDSDVIRYMGLEIQPFVDQSIDFAFPLVSMDRLIGIMFLQLNPNGLTPLGLSRIQGLSRQAGLAFENAILFKERLHQNERIFRAEQLATMGQFAAGMAHELRNPLTAIRSTVQFLGGEFEAGSTQQDLAEGVLTEVDRLNSIIENLLTLSKPTDSSPQELDLKREVEEYLNFVEAQARKQGVQIEVESEEALPRVYCDPGELRQLLLNLVMNAIQAMKGGGMLKIKVFPAAGDRTQTGGVHLEIEDQGEGIAEKDLERVFEPFYTTKKEGTGLGLTICHNIVKRNGGDMWFDQAVGGGTVVHVTLPGKEGSS